MQPSDRAGPAKGPQPADCGLNVNSSYCVLCAVVVTTYATLSSEITGKRKSQTISPLSQIKWVSTLVMKTMLSLPGGSWVQAGVKHEQQPEQAFGATQICTDRS